MGGFQIHTRALVRPLPRARMGNQSTSKTSIPLSFSRVLPSEWIHCELLCNLICPKTILPTALGIWEQKNCQDRLPSLVAKETSPLFLSLLLFMPRNRSGHIPPPPPTGGATLSATGRVWLRVRAAGFAKASLQIWKV